MSEEDDVKFTRSTNGRMDARDFAVSWAEGVMKGLSRVKTPDVPYVKAVLIEAALMETPIKSLAVGINDCGDHYKITISGYKQLIDDAIWCNAFLGANRHPMLDNVARSYTQLTDVGALKVLQVEKVKFQTSVVKHEGSERKQGSFKKRYH